MNARKMNRNLAPATAGTLNLHVNRLLSPLSMISAVLLSAAAGLADPWTTASSYPEAVSLAQAEGKLILADFGRVGCTDCDGMTALFHLTHSPAIS
jgi:hypothetical protein